MKVERIDHLVLTVNDVEATCNFYRDVLGMEVEALSARKKALKFGNQKLDLRPKGREFASTAHLTIPGTIDICFVVAESIDRVKNELEAKGIPIEGMVQRSGATGKIHSVYFRDPDQNLIEVCSYL
jgi:catechol 2,3-dioxygenase-like lactoylglutathione lyase family enzyme